MVGKPKPARIAVFLALFLLLAGISTAYDIESHTVRYSIIEDRAVVQNAITFQQPSSGDFVWYTEPGSTLVEVYIDGEKSNFSRENSRISISLSSAKKVVLSYITEELVDSSNFLLNMPIDYDTESLRIVVVLPEEAVLEEQITDRGGSIYPRPDKTATDGRSLIFIWEMEMLVQGDEISIFVMYKQKAGYIAIAGIALLVALAIFAAYLAYSRYYLKIKGKSKERKALERKAKSKPSKKKSSEAKPKKSKPEPKLLEHLKEDEQQIVRIIRQKGGSCEQGTLRVITNFSKAHLSRLISELETRKVVYKEKRGKKNLVFLK